MEDAEVLKELYETIKQNSKADYADSNPGKKKFTPGGVGRNIAQNLALLGNKAWLLSAVGIVVNAVGCHHHLSHVEVDISASSHA